jgi:molybdopterin synthase catalytic subunit
MTVVLATITAERLDPDALDTLVRRHDAGAVVTFTGRVRDHDGGRSVTSLDYSAHPEAEALLQSIADEIASTPGVLALGVSHRVGSLVIGDAAIVAAVACAHRGDAFTVCGRLVDEVKHRLPVWKKQVFADGTDEWVNAC